MSSPTHTPPPKASRAKHQYSKSATPTAVASGGKTTQRRQRNNRNNHDNNHTVSYQTPQAEAMSNGFPFYDPRQTNSAQNITLNDHARDDGAVSDSTKTARQRYNQSQHSPYKTPAFATLPGSPPNEYSQIMQSPMAQNSTPAKSQAAYAGPTFHASPAPSALPMPKFFSKSVPGTTYQSSLQSRLDSESDSTSSPLSPPPVINAEAPGHEESPLDIFFKADREEKAKRSSGLFTPNTNEQLNHSTSNIETSGKDSSGSEHRLHHSRHNSHGSGKGLFTMELDGSGISPYVPATTSPMTNRSATTLSQIPQTGGAIGHEMDARALKDLLFSFTQPGSQLSTPLSRPDRIPSEPSSRLQSPSPFYQPKSATRSASGPTTPAPQSNAAPNPSLYYGNRNLSPLFKAAKSDSIKRASNLRKEINPVSPTAKHSEFPVVKPQVSSADSHKGVPNHLDASAMPRNHLETVMKPASVAPSVAPTELSGQTFGTRSGIALEPIPSGLQFHPSSRRNASSAANVDGVNPHSCNVTSPSPKNLNYASTNSAEIESMENNLRRLLNLNTVGGNITGVR